MTKVGQVEGELISWLTREWKKIGQLLQEIDVGFLKTGAPTRIGTITKTQIDAYENPAKEIGQTIEDMLEEHRQWHAGKLRYEIQIWGGKEGSTNLGVKTVERLGRGEPEEPMSIGKDEVLAMYMREARKDRELTISTLQKQIDVLERRLDKQYGVIDIAMAKYPELLGLMNNLADTEVEREIRRRQAYRIEGIKDRAVANLPALVGYLTGGKVNLLGMGDVSGTPMKASEIMAKAEGPLVEFMKSLQNMGERGLEIGKLLEPRQQQLLLTIAALVEEYERAKAQEAKDKEIGVKAKEEANGQPQAT